MEPIALRWYGTIGFVLVQGTDPGGDWFKVYIGNGGGLNEHADTKHIAARGMPLGDEALARVLAGPRVANREYRF